MSVGLVVVIGAFLVLLLTSLVKNVEWSSKTKNLLTMAVSLVVGLGAALLEAGSVDALAASPGGVMGVVSAIYLSSQVVYKFVMDGSRVEEFLSEKKVV